VCSDKVSKDSTAPVSSDDLTGQALIAAMQASPHREIDLAPARMQMPVRGVTL
jgi:hypothetical protein